MTVRFSWTYSPLTNKPTKRAKSLGFCAAYHDAVIGIETLVLSLDGSTWLDSNVPMQMAFFCSQERMRKVSELWIVTGVCVALGACVAQVRTDERNKDRKA